MMVGHQRCRAGCRGLTLGFQRASVVAASRPAARSILGSPRRDPHGRSAGAALRRSDRRAHAAPSLRAGSRRSCSPLSSATSLARLARPCSQANAGERRRTHTLAARLPTLSQARPVSTAMGTAWRAITSVLWGSIQMGAGTASAAASKPDGPWWVACRRSLSGSVPISRWQQSMSQQGGDPLVVTLIRVSPVPLAYAAIDQQQCARVVLQDV